MSPSPPFALFYKEGFTSIQRPNLAYSKYPLSLYPTKSKHLDWVGGWVCAWEGGQVGGWVVGWVGSSWSSMVLLGILVEGQNNQTSIHGFWALLTCFGQLVARAQLCRKSPNSTSRSSSSRIRLAWGCLRHEARFSLILFLRNQKFGPWVALL